MPNKQYIVYDGRAKYDEDRASVLETFGEETIGKKADRQTAIDYFRNTWADHDAVLFEYEDNGVNLVCGELVDSIY